MRSNAPDARGALSARGGDLPRAAETHPVVRAIASSEVGDELLPLLTTRGGPLVAEVTGRLAGVLVENWPELSSDDANLVSDCLVRLAISYAALPAGSRAKWPRLCRKSSGRSWTGSRTFRPPPRLRLRGGRVS